ncbi:hypothetical protein NEAUS03_1653 [Nematocida ausubeli]|nr:hypothetical protein NEAUS03_1653 [Nematocida ausubeli]
MAKYIVIYTVIMVCCSILSSMCTTYSECNNSDTAKNNEFMEVVNGSSDTMLPVENYNSVDPMISSRRISSTEDSDILDGTKQSGSPFLMEDMDQSDYITNAPYYPDDLEILVNEVQVDNVISKFYINEDKKTFYANSQGDEIYIYFTGNVTYINNTLYNVYSNYYGSLVYIDSKIAPISFITQGKNNTTTEILKKCTSEKGAGENHLSCKRRGCCAPKTSRKRPTVSKSKRVKNTKKLNNTITVRTYNKSAKNKEAYKSLEAYKKIAQSKLEREKPHYFSYRFTKSDTNNENTKCECSIQKNYKSELQFWHFLASSRHNSLAEKIECIENLMNTMKVTKEEREENKKRVLYYHSFLEDFGLYIETHIDIAHISARYDYTDSRNNNICSMSRMEPETLGEIYEETQTDLKWWANSMSIISVKTEDMKNECSIDDAALKEKLHFILKLPEVLRDLVLITPEILSKTKEEMEKAFDSEARKVFCLIEYLYYIVNGNSGGMYAAYKKVKALFVKVKPIDDYTTMDVYRWTYYIFFVFYQCAPFTCVNDATDITKYIENKEAHIRSIFESYCPCIPRNGVFRLHGKRAITQTKINKYDKQAKIYKHIPNPSNSKLDAQTSKAIDTEESMIEYLKIGSSDHYHIQFVDNSCHTVKTIPIPCFYISEASNGGKSSYIQKKIHSIGAIVDYLKSILKSTYPERNLDFNIYAFSYGRISRAWAIIDDLAEFSHKMKLKIDCTLGEMCAEEIDVIFYYFEENIYTTKFAVVDFISQNTPGTNGAIRIPIFLTNFMLKSTIVAPYMQDRSKDVFSTRMCYSSDYLIRCNNIFQNNFNKDADSPKPQNAPSENKSLPKENYISYYYSDFFVRNIYSLESCTEECFNMCASNKLSQSGCVKSISWFAQIKRSIREYTNYCFSIFEGPNVQKKYVNQCDRATASKFLNMLQRDRTSGDKVTYGVCIYHRSLDGKEIAVPIMCEKIRRLLSENIDIKLKYKYANWESNILPPRIDIKDIKENSTVFITVKTFNYKQANLGIHYDIMAALFHNNNDSILKSETNPSTSL